MDKCNNDLSATIIFSLLRFRDDARYLQEVIMQSKRKQLLVLSGRETAEFPWCHKKPGSCASAIHRWITSRCNSAHLQVWIIAQRTNYFVYVIKMKRTYVSMYFRFLLAVNACKNNKWQQFSTTRRWKCFGHKKCLRFFLLCRLSWIVNLSSYVERAKVTWFFRSSRLHWARKRHQQWLVGCMSALVTMVAIVWEKKFITRLSRELMCASSAFESWARVPWSSAHTHRHRHFLGWNLKEICHVKKRIPRKQGKFCRVKSSHILLWYQLIGNARVNGRNVVGGLGRWKRMVVVVNKEKVVCSTSSKRSVMLASRLNANPQLKATLVRFAQLPRSQQTNVVGGLLAV